MTIETQFRINGFLYLLAACCFAAALFCGGQTVNWSKNPESNTAYRVYVKSIGGTNKLETQGTNASLVLTQGMYQVAVSAVTQFTNDLFLEGRITNWVAVLVTNQEHWHIILMASPSLVEQFIAVTTNSFYPTNQSIFYRLNIERHSETIVKSNISFLRLPNTVAPPPLPR